MGEKLRGSEGEEEGEMRAGVQDGGEGKRKSGLWKTQHAPGFNFQA